MKEQRHRHNVLKLLRLKMGLKNFVPLCLCPFAAIFLFFLTLLTCSAHALDNTTQQIRSGEAAPYKEVFSTTHHVVKLGKKKLHYTATAGQLVLRDERGKQKAQIFFVAYKAKNKNTPSRPLTFAFNGGPGSSSVWLHFGAMGPRRVLLKDDGSPPPLPASLRDNEYTWLDFTDIVFIDPVGTGYSRSLDEKKENQFYGFKEDIKSIGDFIRLYLTRYNRWLSPKYIVGESYGTTRAVGLTEYMHDTHGVDFNGIVLISPVLDFNTILFGSSNNLPYVLSFPTIAATAMYHKKISHNKSLPDTLDDVERWVEDEYITCLARGNGLNQDEEKAFAETISGYSGISENYILKNGLKITSGRFRKELLRNEKKVIGRMDSRFTGPDTNAAADLGSYDPSLEMLIGTFSSSINHYIRNDLNFKNDTPYKYLNCNISRTWKWKSGIQRGQGYVNVSRLLTEAIHINKYLNVFIASGYYDFATPYFAAKYTINHLDLDKALRDNVSIHFYNAGHMMYINKPSLQKLTEDIALFYKSQETAGQVR